MRLSVGALIAVAILVGVGSLTHSPFLDTNTAVDARFSIHVLRACDIILQM